MNANVPLKVQEAIFNQIFDRPENKVCADCPNKSPTWASIDFGVFVCLRCSGAHRRLSPVVTRVRSAKIDSWLMDHIEMMAATGNKIANDYWEASLPSYFKKPDLSTSLEDVFEVVKDKYVKALYAAKDCINPVKEFLEARKDGQTTAGTFNQAKMRQKTNTQEVAKTTTTTTTTTTTAAKTTKIKTAENKPSSQNLIDFDDDFGEFKSAPAKNVKMDISKPDLEVKFVSNTQKSRVDLWGSAFENTSSSVDLQKARSADPFSFEQPQNPPPTLTQKANSASKDSNKLYELYKTGGQEQQNTIKSVSGQNFTGGQSNYAFLDGFGSQQTQQNRFGQPQQGFGVQSGMNGQTPKNQSYGGGQTQPIGFGGQSNFNKLSGGFDFGGSTNSSSSGGFGGAGKGYGSSGNEFNSFGSNGLNSGSFNAFEKQQQPQPFSFNQPTATFSCNTVSSTQSLSQPTSVNTGFSFF